MQQEEYAEDVANGEYRICSSDDESLKSRCNAVPLSGGTSIIGEELIFMDLRDSVCQVSQAIEEARSSEWITAATYFAELTVVLYNGELGVYSVVDLKLDLSDRGGKLEPHSTVLTAQVPLRNVEWFVLEVLMVLSMLR